MAGETTAAVPKRGRPKPYTHTPNEPRKRGRPKKEADDQLNAMVATMVKKEEKTALAAVAGGPGKVSAYVRRLIEADPAFKAKLEESTMTG
jgi:hypothetical protein